VVYPAAYSFLCPQCEKVTNLPQVERFPECEYCYTQWEAVKVFHRGPKGRVGAGVHPLILYMPPSREHASEKPVTTVERLAEHGFRPMPAGEIELLALGYVWQCPGCRQNRSARHALLATVTCAFDGSIYAVLRAEHKLDEDVLRWGATPGARYKQITVQVDLDDDENEPGQPVDETEPEEALEPIEDDGFMRGFA
jgi:hypothetical protein